MLLLGLLAAMMLAASPVLAWQPGPGEGSKFGKNYYPTSYFNYCEPDGDKFFGDSKSSNDFWCDTYYTEYKKKSINGKKYYYVHVYYEWRTPDRSFAQAGLLVLLPVSQVQRPGILQAVFQGLDHLQAHGRSLLGVVLLRRIVLATSNTCLHRAVLPPPEHRLDRVCAT